MHIKGTVQPKIMMIRHFSSYMSDYVSTLMIHLMDAVFQVSSRINVENLTSCRHFTASRLISNREENG